MEISKGLQEEILTVQNKLKIAIRDHQICVGKLNDDPNNTDILRRIQEIQLHIVTLGRCQKQVVQRLRKEVELFKAQNSNGVKVSIATLLGLNNNNHIMNNNKEKHNKVEGKTHREIKSSKEHYEETVRNGDVSYAIRDDVLSKPKLFINKARPCSVETVSEDDDVIEISIDENSNEKQEIVEREPEIEGDDDKLNFLNNLGLITGSKYIELQNKRAERKRRSTANPQFVYSNLDLPTKRKRYSYLQSGNAPQTRQSTARLNGPSPPLSKTVGQKSTSPSNRTTPLIPIQKATTRPNILRNTSESKIYTNKQTTKSVPLGMNKTVHIPGLPSSLTIERIESDTIVCISCRNPGTLAVCEKCSSSYHLSCHNVSPAPGKTCPKCVHGEKNNAKKELEIAATTHAAGVVGKTGENSEINQTSGGLYKIDAGQKKQQIPSALGIGPLPTSTLLIPISSNANNGQSSERPMSTNDVPYPSIIVDQRSQPTVTFVTTDPQPSYSYQLPINNVQPEQHQSYLIVKKITEPIGRNDGEQSNNERNVFLNSGNKKSNNIRPLPALNRIIGSEKFTIANNYEVEENVYRRPNKVRPIRPKIGNFNHNQFGSRASEFLVPSYELESSQNDKLSEESDLCNIRPRQVKPRSSSGLLHALFSGYNQSHIVTSDPYESQIVTNSNERIGSNFNRYQTKQQLEPSNNESGNAQRSRSALTKFFDHVKLEEAHLSAPLRTKLEHQGTDRMTSFVLRDFIDSTSSGTNQNTSWVPGRIISRKTRKSDSVLEVLQRNSNESLKPTLDVFHLEKNHTFSRLCSYEDNGKFVEKKVALLKRCKSSGGGSEDTEYCIKENVALTNRGTNLLNLTKSCEENDDVGSVVKSNISLMKNDNGIVESQGEEYLLKNDRIIRNVSVPDDKAETERQDLIGGRRSISDNEIDTPEQTIKEGNKNILYEEIKERLNFNTVSSESLQVLEQFESAVLDVDRVGSATR